MLHFFMNQQYLYYGIIAAGILGLVSTILTDLYYRTIVRDVKRVRKAKGKWMRAFTTELDNRNLLKQDMHNGEAFIRTRLAEGKILGIPVGSLHTFGNWMAFMTAAITLWGLYSSYRTEAVLPLTYLAAGASACGVLLLLPVLFGIGRKQERIVNGLTDYIQNCLPGKAPVAAPVVEPVKEKERMLDQIVAGIRQSAAAGTKFSGLLSKDEEHILREVIQEYM